MITTEFQKVIDAVEKYNASVRAHNESDCFNTLVDVANVVTDYKVTTGKKCDLLGNEREKFAYYHTILSVTTIDSTDDNVDQTYMTAEGA